MSQLVARRNRRSLAKVHSPQVTTDWLDDASSFGLQGLMRQPLEILKAESIHTLAVSLALRGNRRQIRDPEFVQHVISRTPGIMQEYRIVHLIEKSLWIRGQSDLVMTLTRNPSQIPDNPPTEVMNAVTKAYGQHPDATVWFGVPLFSDQVNAEGLPIPVTASEVQAEARKRIETAQQQALRWGWLYRAVAGVASVPVLMRGLYSAIMGRIRHAHFEFQKNWKRARQDAKLRSRAMIRAEMEHCRYGCSFTEIPEHSTTIGKVGEMGSETLFTIDGLLRRYAPTLAAGLAPGGLIMPAMFIAKLLPLLTTPAIIITADPFLFIELPEEPDKLRHLAHWYWQGETYGQQKLHLHI
jgi:hypothetical protein